MNLPKIDLSSLPDLETVTGVFGSLLDTTIMGASDDRIIILMVYVYDNFPPEGSMLF